MVYEVYNFYAPTYNYVTGPTMYLNRDIDAPVDGLTKGLLASVFH